jgi:hypothetical protein
VSVSADGIWTYQGATSFFNPSAGTYINVNGGGGGGAGSITSVHVDANANSNAGTQFYNWDTHQIEQVAGGQYGTLVNVVDPNQASGFGHIGSVFVSSSGRAYYQELQGDGDYFESAFNVPVNSDGTVSNNALAQIKDWASNHWYNETGPNGSGHMSTTAAADVRTQTYFYGSSLTAFINTEESLASQHAPYLLAGWNCLDDANAMAEAVNAWQLSFAYGAAFASGDPSPNEVLLWTHLYTGHGY